ncbi:hypothetical protein NL676_037354 [Syzygium grande]|nr:hypothetical protein NL676_037354 [Syzygium grande]
MDSLVMVTKSDRHISVFAESKPDVADHKRLPIVFLDKGSSILDLVSTECIDTEILGDFDATLEAAVACFHINELRTSYRVGFGMFSLLALSLRMCIAFRSNTNLLATYLPSMNYPLSMADEYSSGN